MFGSSVGRCFSCQWPQEWLPFSLGPINGLQGLHLHMRLLLGKLLSAVKHKYTGCIIISNLLKRGQINLSFYSVITFDLTDDVKSSPFQRRTPLARRPSLKLVAITTAQTLTHFYKLQKEYDIRWTHIQSFTNIFSFFHETVVDSILFLLFRPRAAYAYVLV